MIATMRPVVPEDIRNGGRARDAAVATGLTARLPPSPFVSEQFRPAPRTCGCFRGSLSVR